MLDPQRVVARQVCELYRRRWRIEDAFALTKRVLDLAYLWTGSSNAVQLQIDATLLFYAVLLTICQQVAPGLGRVRSLSWLAVFMALHGVGIGVCFAHLSSRTISAARRGEEHLTASSIATVRSLGQAFGAATTGLIANAAGLARGGLYRDLQCPHRSRVGHS